MKAAVLEAFGEPFKVQDVHMADTGPGEVVVRTGGAAFCVTDCINARGEFGKSTPTVLGHAAVGVVEETGPQVTRVKPGDRVLCGGTPECGRCYWCGAGRPDQCIELRNACRPLGVTDAGLEVTSTAVGGYAEMMLLPEAWVFPVESSLGDDALALMGCGITSGLGAVFNVARVTPGSSVVVIGAGHLGLWMTQAARVAGAERVIVVEPRAARAELAQRLGATHVVDADADEAVEAVRDLTGGRGADYVLEAAGDPAAIRDAVLMTDNIGVTVLTCFKHIESTATLPVLELALRGRDIRACQNGRVRYVRDVPRYIELLESGALDWETMVSRRFRIEDIMRAYDDADARRGLTSVLVTPTTR